MTHADKKRRLWNLIYGEGVQAYRLFPDLPLSQFPTEVVVDADPLVLGVEFRVDEFNCFLTNFHYWQPSGGGADAVERLAGLFDAVSGAQVGETATLPFTSSEAPGKWSSSRRLEEPIPLVPNKRYVAAVLCATKQFGLKANFFGAADTRVTGSPILLSGTTNAVGNNQGSYSYGSELVVPRNSANAANYFVDVTIQQEK